jgi:hypothetical protein
MDKDEELQPVAEEEEEEEMASEEEAPWQGEVAMLALLLANVSTSESVAQILDVGPPPSPPPLPGLAPHLSLVRA